VRRESDLRPALVPLGTLFSFSFFNPQKTREIIEMFLIAPILENPSSPKFKILSLLIPPSPLTTTHRYPRAPSMGTDGELIYT